MGLKCKHVIFFSLKNLEEPLAHRVGEKMQWHGIIINRGAVLWYRPQIKWITVGFSVTEINVTHLRQTERTFNEILHLRRCWLSLSRLHSGPPHTPPCSWCTPHSESSVCCRHARLGDGWQSADDKEEWSLCLSHMNYTKTRRPVCESHTILLDVQHGKFLVVPQALLRFAGDPQIKTQHGVRLQLHRLTSLQTFKRHRYSDELRMK